MPEISDERLDEREGEDAEPVAWLQWHEYSGRRIVSLEQLTAYNVEDGWKERPLYASPHPVEPVTVDEGMVERARLEFGIAALDPEASADEMWRRTLTAALSTK